MLFSTILLQLKEELFKFMNNDNIDEKSIIFNMDYLIDITPTIENFERIIKVIIPLKRNIIYWLL